MFNIEIYENKNGDSSIINFLEKLNVKARTSKTHRVRLKKIAQYISLLKEHGSRAGLPAMKHIDGYLGITSHKRPHFFYLLES